MNDRALAPVAVMRAVIRMMLVALFVSLPLWPQSDKATKSPSPAVARAAKKWRTPWGDPDLQGSWSNGTTTPLERPAMYAGREFMTSQEMEEKRLTERAAIEKRGTPGSEAVGFVWFEDRVMEDRTSLIYDPADGQIPALTPEGEKRRAELMISAPRQRDIGPFDGPEDIEIRTRCIIRDALPRLPGTYGNGYEIVQTPGFVAIVQETIHETRLVPLRPRAHLDQSVRQWFGDSRGHWEGETLVVETTNFNDKTKFLASTQNLVLVERWTRVADGRIDYRFTVRDPATWTKPWSAAIPWNKSGPLYEYACHEDNIDMYGILTGARAKDKKAGVAIQK